MTQLTAESLGELSRKELIAMIVELSERLGRLEAAHVAQFLTVEDF
jgi:hypothetical protein